MKWMALAQTLGGEHCSPPDAIPLYCQIGILRAGRKKSAGRRQERRKESLIEVQACQNALLYQFQVRFAAQQIPADLLIPRQSQNHFRDLLYSSDESPHP